ncbi:uncharacterized protein [Chelonus insularis]|uniref:uncharacterized protein n=1 Tax=Chelonus insularis TaxID=460826 RepID=UPI00158BB3FD|nr:uncharacterized protein LOC118069889 [Chelonus insularis]
MTRIDQSPEETASGEIAESQAIIQDNITANSTASSSNMTDNQQPTGNQGVREFSDDNGIASVEFKLPPFWKQDPALWFIQVDAIFHRKRITSDSSKYWTVISHIDPELLQHVSDIVKKPPEADMYNTLKENLISRLSTTQEQQLQILLDDIELGDNKPLQLLRKMQDLADNKVTEDVLRSLWLKRLPANVRFVLSANVETSLTAAATLADRLVEINPIQSVMAVSKVKDVATATPIKLSEEQRLDKLGKAVQALQVSIKEINNGRKSRDHTPRSRSRARSRSFHRSPAQNNGICFYHERFGVKANKCEEGCTFIQKQGN